MDNWEWLVSVIPSGQAAALPMKDLAQRFGISKRETRKMIEDARRAGILICSCDKGYFMPETVPEIREYAQRVKARIRTGALCLAPFLREIRRAEGIRI